MSSNNHYARFLRVSNNIEVEHGYRSEYGHNLTTALRAYGRSMPRRIARVFRTLTDEELSMACSALYFAALQPKPMSGAEYYAFRIIGGYELVSQATILSITIPTYLKLNGPTGRVDGAEFYDGENTHSLISLLRIFTAKRVNKLHGYVMIDLAPHEAISQDDAEWFGQNREQIIPIWDHIVQGSVFTRGRVQTLIDGSSSGALGLLEGAL